MSDNIDVDSYIDICKTEEEDSDPITSTEMVRRYFKLRSGVCRMFAQSMRNIQSAADDILRSLETDKIVNFSHAKLEREIKALRDWDGILADLAQHDGDLCLEIKNSFNNYKDDEKDMVILKSHLRRLNEAKKVFVQEAERADIAKEKYHRVAFEAEKAEIKKEIAEIYTEIRKYTDRCEELKKKAENKFGYYQEQLNVLSNTGHALKTESNKYAEANLQVNQRRASFILDRLQTYATKARLKTDAVEDCNFNGLKINDIVKNRQPMEYVTIKRIERYRGTSNKDALFRLMREEIEAERRRQRTQDDVAPGPSSANGHVTPEPTSVIKVGQKYLVTTAFKKERPNQISLTQGKKITLLMPPNTHGLAFGEKKGRFGRKKKGYFPMSHVVPAD